MILAYADLKDAAPAAQLDRWLRFDRRIEARYEADTRSERVEELRHAIFFGVVFSDFYLFADWALMPDILALTVAIRLAAVTPIALAFSYIIPRLSCAWRERMIVFGMISATFGPVTLFWFTHSPFGPFIFSDLTLCVVYANMNLPLRFRDAAIYSLFVCVTAILAMAAKTGVEPQLRVALDVQFATAIAFTLYANYHRERRRRMDYLATLLAQLRSEEAERTAERLSDISETDVLSGLPNRRYLDRRLDEWLSQTQPIALAMIDVDHFKAYNDCLGHPAGDECLREIGAALKELAVGDDALAARYGGEEFTFAARGADELEARRLALRIVKSIGALELPHPGRADGLAIVTVSVGVCLSAPNDGGSKSALFAAADGALYEAKRRGRNRYVFADPSDAAALAKA
jgi:diguanylate cyclase (GGDEF)-like protein